MSKHSRGGLPFSACTAHLVHMILPAPLNLIPLLNIMCYFLTRAIPESRAISIHQLSKKVTQRIPFKLHGLPVSTAFHPSRSVFFISTKMTVRVYDLLKHELIKKLETGLRNVSSIAIHPGGDNVIVGSREGKLCWFDMDLSSQPYKILRCHPKDITSVAYHRTYPLFASCSDDGTAYVFHGMVYSDLNENPRIRNSSWTSKLKWKRDHGLQVPSKAALVIHRRR